jgi:hypothetical protein
VEQRPFPKLAPTTVRRRTIENWFAFHKDTPLRYVYGPTGSGKTTATLLHGRLARHAVAYAQVPAAGTAAALLIELKQLFNCFAGELNEFPSSLRTDERLELVLANIDNADDEVREFLTRLPSLVPPNVTLTYLARARRVVDIVALTTKGIAAPLDRSLLAFTQAEAAELCDALDVAYTPAEINQLIYASEGWAFAVSGSIRDAAADGRDLHGALTRWQERNRRLIEELLTRSVAGLPPAEAEAAQRIYSGENPTAEPSYDRLHDLGLLLSFGDADLRPLRAVVPSALRRSAQLDLSAPTASVPMATVEMFGQFEMIIDGRKVEWCRRRDRLIVEFLAMQPDTSATRHKLISTFWPDTDAQLAKQSLRTACSTIRRAIAQCVGYDRVAYYFTPSRSLRLNTDNISISSLRLIGHMREAEDASARGDVSAAEAHYLAASRIYRGRLLDSEGVEPWFRNERETFSAMAAGTAERLLDMRGQKRTFGNHGITPTRLSFSA